MDELRVRIDVLDVLSVQLCPCCDDEEMLPVLSASL